MQFEALSVQKKMRFLDILRFSPKALVMDGAYGTCLQSYTDGRVEELCITNPKVVVDLHQSYLRSGADILISNTFSVNPYNYNDADMGHLIQEASECLRKATTGEKRSVYKGYDIGSLGKLIKPLGDLTYDEVYQAYVKVFKKVPQKFYDFIYIETQQSLYEAKAAILAAKEFCPSLPIVASFTYQPDGRLLTGEDVRMVQFFCKAIGVTVCGINCSGGPSEVSNIIKEVLSYNFIPTLVKVNAGIPVSSDSKTIKYTETSTSFTTSLADLKADKFAAILGGCCGTNPQFISELRKLVDRSANCHRHLHTLVSTLSQGQDFTKSHLKTVSSLPDSVVDFRSLDNFNDFIRNGVVLSSGSTSVIAYPKQTEEPLHRPLVIGEQINPTGKSPAKLALQQAIKDRDLSFILDLARSQVSHGAELLDVNLGSAYDLYPEVIQYLQEHLSTPLVIDYPMSEIPTTTQLKYLSDTLRIYNGIPLLNSLSTKTQFNELILREFGAVSIYLPITDGQFDGTIPVFPDTLKVVDPLCFSLSTNPRSFYDLTKHLTEYHSKSFLTSLGLSNISFKCPDRPTVNILAFTLLPHLNFAIVNPEQFESVIKSYNTLRGEISAPSDLSPLLRSLLDQVSVNSDLDGYLKALDEALGYYNASKLSLPQLVTVSESIIKNLPSNTNHKATFLIATIKGDLHDLGKNIVASVLRASGYKVIDLGKNVDADTILKALSDYKPDFIGLSSLLTTTIPTMCETVYILKENYNTPIIVGGAVYSEELVKSMGADFYAKDAPATVEFCNKCLSC